MPRLVPPLSARSGPDTEDIDYAHRDFVNLAAAALLLVVALMITWTVVAIDRNERTQRCFEQGRKDCVTIAAPPHGLRIPAH
jgi:hypothetical protein